MGASPPTPANAVEIRGLNVILGGRTVLRDIDLNLASGALIALIGPNGAGKTTLVRSILGLVPAASGTIRVLGQTHLRSALPRIGYVPQRLALGDGLALNVREFLSLRRRSTRNWFWRRRADLDATLPPITRELGILPLLDKPVTTLSGGQLQRVLIAFALLDQPDLLFLDEPTEGVDAPGERTFYEIISDIHRSHPLTVVLVSHDLSMVHRHASWVVALNGRVCCEGAPEEIIREDALREAYGLQVAVYHHHHGGDHHHGHHGIAHVHAHTGPAQDGLKPPQEPKRPDAGGCGHGPDPHVH